MTKPQDPNFQREAEKYANPIPSREYIIELLDKNGEPLTYARIAKALGLEDEDSLEALRRRLKAMVRDGQLIKNRKEGFAPLAKMDLIRGRVIGHPDGFGFLVPEEGGQDLFLSGKEMRAVMHGDRVVARLSGYDDRRGRKEGAIVDVLERAHPELVGRLFVESGIAFVVPENKRITQDIAIPPEDTGGAKNGQIVVIAISQPPTRYRQAVGRVVEVVGDHMAPGMEIDIAIRDHSLPQEWSEAVQREIAHLDPTHIPEEAIKGREDLRRVPLVTIDGEDARDFDDAVFCERQGKGWRLLVAIADVSYYVQRGTSLDGEARERGTSVYFPGRVIPMLPEVLSNGLCSLNPDVDRLCMVCELNINSSGAVTGFRFFDAVMRSHARFTYTKVAKMLVDGDMALRREYELLVPHLQDLYDLYQAFRKRREKRGAIDFESTETKIEFGPEKKIERIVPVERNDAHKLIEECMIAANVAAAEFLLEYEIPALYRIHDGPGGEKLTDLRAFLAELGLSLGGGDKPEAKHYAKLMQTIQDRPDRHLIQTVMLRSMSQAVYHPENIGHFGLSYEAYAHFTSPIRRYPDLMVHRAIRHLTQGRKVGKFPWSLPDMQTLGEHCSMTERRADEATRDATDWLKCEYMMDKVGEAYDGIITSVTGFGLFVQLNDIYVEGLVHVTSLEGDYYHFDPVKHRLTGERSGRSYRLADPIRVQVARVSLDDRKIDFMLADGADVKTFGIKSKSRRGKGKGEARPAREERSTGKGAGRKSTKKGGAPEKASREKGSREKASTEKASTKKTAKKKSAKKAAKKSGKSTGRSRGRGRKD